MISTVCREIFAQNAYVRLGAFVRSAGAAAWRVAVGLLGPRCRPTGSQSQLPRLVQASRPALLQPCSRQHDGKCMPCATARQNSGSSNGAAHGASIRNSANLASAIRPLRSARACRDCRLHVDVFHNRRNRSVIKQARRGDIGCLRSKRYARWSSTSRNFLPASVEQRRLSDVRSRE